MKKILSMCAFGNDLRYVIGAHKQALLAKKYYPDFEVWLYTDQPGIYQIEGKIIGMPANTDGALWRFFPFFRGEDTIVLCRDADSRITEREFVAVQEWLVSDAKMHTIRDHEWHFQLETNPILASGFGLKGCWPESVFEIFLKETMFSQFRYGRDEEFLCKYIWPQYKNNILIHSMQAAGWFAETRKDLLNPYEFCLNGWDQHDLPLYAPNGELARNHQNQLAFWRSFPDQEAPKFNQYGKTHGNQNLP